jgi:DNA-directed RNA polymerase specialized sigma24 family protein
MPEDLSFGRGESVCRTAPAMSELQAKTKRGWAPTQSAFRRLLGWLDEGRDSDGRSYLEMHRRLVAYFDRKNCSTPDELADETLNRVARRLEEEGAIVTETPAKYCYTVARHVFMEHLRGTRKANALIDDARLRPSVDDLAAAEAARERELKEKMLDCLEECAGKLEPPNRELIIRYYTGKGRARIEGRRALAEELGVTVNALSIRACRIRDKLEECVRRCAGTE